MANKDSTQPFNDALVGIQADLPCENKAPGDGVDIDGLSTGPHHRPLSSSDGAGTKLSAPLPKALVIVSNATRRHRRLSSTLVPANPSEP